MVHLLHRLYSVDAPADGRTARKHSVHSDESDADTDRRRAPSGPPRRDPPPRRRRVRPLSLPAPTHRHATGKLLHYTSARREVCNADPIIILNAAALSKPLSVQSISLL